MLDRRGGGDDVAVVIAESACARPDSTRRRRVNHRSATAAGHSLRTISTASKRLVRSRADGVTESMAGTRYATCCLQQMQDYGHHFANLEERVQQRLKEIESQVARKLSASSPIRWTRAF